MLLDLSAESLCSRLFGLFLKNEGKVAFKMSSQT